MELNNRELAMLVWTGIVLILMLRNRESRRLLGSLAQTALQPVILLPVLAFAASDPRLARHVKWKLLARLRWRTRRVGRFDRRWQSQLASVDSPDEADQIVDQSLEQERKAA